MVTTVEIFKQLKNGLREACDNALNFTGKFTVPPDIEYLLTVNVAQAIGKLNGDNFGEPYKIYLERSTKEFCRDCVPLTIPDPNQPANWNGVGKRWLLRKVTKRNTIRNGRIDIAVNDDSGLTEKAVCAIELKGINPACKPVVADLKRNAEYFAFVDQAFPKKPAGSVKTEIAIAIFACVFSYPNVMYDSELAKNEARAKKKLQGWLAQVGLPSHIRASVETWTVRNWSIPVNYVPEPDEELPDELHHFVGAAVTYEWI